MKRYLYPNAHQNARTAPVAVAAEQKEDLPAGLTRLGARKFNYLVRGVAQLEPADKVLELFGGTNFGTVIIARRLHGAANIATVDLHYSPAESWHYVFEENYAALARLHGVSPGDLPQFIAADARRLPLAAESFDAALSADSPRTHGEAGLESPLGPEEQRQLFCSSAREALRVLKPGGLFAGSTPTSWIEDLAEDAAREIYGLRVMANETLSPAVRFKDSPDPIVYFKLNKR